MQGTVENEFRHKTIFNLLGQKGYFRLGFSHNILAVSLLNEFRADLDHLEETGVGPQAGLAHPRGDLQQAGEGVLLDEGEELLLVLEVVVEVADRHPQLRRDVPHPGRLQAAATEDPRSRVEDLALLLQDFVALIVMTAGFLPSRGGDLNHRSKVCRSGAARVKPDQPIERSAIQRLNRA